MRPVLLLPSLLVASSLLAQAPDAFNYQAVARDANGDPISNQTISMAFQVTGPGILFEELHTGSVVTDARGSFNVKVGSGTLTFGVPLDSIDWGGSGTLLLQVFMDPAGGSAYAYLGAEVLSSVPYALYALDVQNKDDADADPTNELQTISRTGTTVTLSHGGGTFQDSVGVYTGGTGIDITNNVVGTSPCYTLGQLVPALGGYIFYLDGSGCHGLVVKTADEPGTYQYSNLNSFQPGALAEGLYAGEANTFRMISRAAASNGTFTCPAATQAALPDLGFTDWYLPSRDEFDLMDMNLHQQGLGNFSNNWYWSSTQSGVSDAWSYAFSIFFGPELGYHGPFQKDLPSLVRAVRAF